MMARLIDADAMRQDWLENGENEYVYDTNAVLDSIDVQPTVDAVPVVRCKDCKHWWKAVESCTHDECCDGRQVVVTAPPNHFCSYGERRSDDE